MRPVLLLLGFIGCGGGGSSLNVDADADGVTSESDCDDDNALVHPGAEERCNGIDDDCDGVVDNDASDAPTWYVDADGDGFGLEEAPTRGCEAPAGHAAAVGDCDDTRADVYPGAAEVCFDGADNDCDESANPCVLEGELFTSQAPHYWQNQGNWGCQFVDYNADLYPDAVCTLSGKVYLLPGPLVDTYPRGPILDNPSGSDALPAIGDFTGDGHRDIAYGDGMFSLGPLEEDSESRQILSMTEPAEEVVGGDFNADGQLDLAYRFKDRIDVVLGPMREPTDLQSAAVLELTASEGRIYSLTTGDVWGDSASDLIFDNNKAVVVDGRRRGALTTADADVSNKGAGYTSGDLHGDLTGDGVQDLVLRFRPAEGQDRFEVFEGDPVDLSAGPIATIQGGAEPVAVGDLDGDGVDDMVLFEASPNVYSVLRGPLEGTLTAADAYLTIRHDVPGEWTTGSRAHIVDFDQDGLADIFVMARSPQTEANTYGYVFWGDAR